MVRCRRSWRRWLSLAWVLSVLAAGCERPPPIVADAGPEEDAGIPDAGRPAGDNPPTGYSVAVENASSATGKNELGLGVSLALDQHDQPMVAYVHRDPNGDDVLTDSRLMFTRWNGVDKRWQDPKMVEVVGDIELGHPHRPVSLARDPVTGMLGVAYVNYLLQVRLGLSGDEGELFSLEAASGSNPQSRVLTDPSLALRGGEVHLAYVEPQKGLVYRTRTGGPPGAFTETVAPLPSGVSEVLAMPVSVAVDSAGKPGVAFLGAQAGSLGVAVVFWRPGSSTSYVVADSQGVASPTPSVSLAFFQDKPRVAYHLVRASGPEVPAFAAAVDASGSAWATPVSMTLNGPTEGSKWYQALAVDGAGKLALAAYFASTTQQQQCGGPKLGRSTDGLAFSVCSPDGARFFNFAGLWLNAAYSKGGKLTLAFYYDQKFNPQIKSGVVIWREP